LQELEQKLATYQTEDRRKDIEHRLALQKMEAENRHLKTLLNLLGISTELLQQYVQLAEQGESVDKKVAIPAMHKHVETSSMQPVKEKLVPSKSNPIVPGTMAKKNPEKTTQSADKTWKASDPPLCKCSPGQKTLASGPVDGDVLNTTMRDRRGADESIQYSWNRLGGNQTKTMVWTPIRCFRRWLSGAEQYSL
jgi:hypothetical protein